MSSDTPSGIESIKIKNYRLLRDVSFAKLTKLTVLTGANGSGKSTVFDVFAFLHEAFSSGLRSAWDARNRMAGIRSVGADGPVEFELKYRTSVHRKSRLVTYQLAIDEERGAPVVVEERMRWTSAQGSGRPRDIIRFSRGQGAVWDEKSGRSEQVELESPDLLAVSALGQFRAHPRVRVLRNFVSGWYLSYISAGNSRTTPVAGPQERLSQTGDNLPNVIQYLQESHPERLGRIFEVLSQRVPHVERVTSDTLADGRLLLRLKDRPFDEPVLARFVSDGTLKLLAYLTIFYDPTPPPVIGIEEPENQLHPSLLPILADEIRQVSASAQVLVTTHSPDFLGAIYPQELWMIGRGPDGFAEVTRASDSQLIMEMIDAGAQLGALWNEGFLAAADPAGIR
ncbi:AAA family ATPase [Skermania piniformis]|uniref:AAA family ATPase n=1 Tax=Skermania pinensis TaxID=39122 RepID=A0ABX8SC56_9ACTN|nr:AAA family ATPase [Skermania piniformis]QXQ15460.1 AAA family ATPase [Skermania piniformis]